MRSLFDPVDDIKLPEERPKRDFKKLLRILGILVGGAVLVAGGWLGYRALFPPQLTERPIPPTPAKLMAELKEARDDIDIQTREIYARIQQFNRRMETLGRKPVSFSQVFLQGLSAEEEAALDDLVRQERDPSYRGILGRVVEDIKKIRELQNKVAELEAQLPGEGVEVKRGDTHIELAKRWLVEERGVPETRARELAERLNIMDARLRPGFRVHFYYDPARDFFGTWVAQGEADRTPLAVVRARRMRLIRERDAAIARADDLEEKKAELEEVLATLRGEINALEVRKANLETSVAQLEAEKSEALAKFNTTQKELERARNSLYYEADLEDRLKARGVLRILNNIEDIGNARFASSLDLRESKSITLEPSQFGLNRIRDVRVVPKFLKEGRDIDVKFGDDGTVEVTVLDEDALRGQRVIFVVN